jgi:hypothetical protein
MTHPALKNVPFWVGVAALLAFVTFFVWRVRAMPRYAIPPPSAVGRIEVVWFYDGHIETKPFEVAKEGWPTLWSALMPAQYDASPRNWQVVADLDIHGKDGVSWRLNLYNTFDDAVGAFSVGPTSELRERTYYRGGNSSELMHVLLEARKSLDGHGGTGPKGPG